MNRIALIIAMSFLIFTAGCETTVRLTTEPAGLYVYHDGMKVGRSPVTFTADNFILEEHKVRFKKDGRTVNVVRLRKEIKWEPLIAGICGGMMCLFPGVLVLWSYGPRENQHFDMAERIEMQRKNRYRGETPGGGAGTGGGATIRKEPKSDAPETKKENRGNAEENSKKATGNNGPAFIRTLALGEYTFYIDGRPLRSEKARISAGRHTLRVCNARRNCVTVERTHYESGKLYSYFLSPAEKK